MNLVALVSEEGYNLVCEFLGANWYALVATAGLAALFVIHIVYAFWLTMQNRKARGTERYAVVEKPKTVEWASQNMSQESAERLKKVVESNEKKFKKILTKEQYAKWEEIKKTKHPANPEPVIVNPNNNL